MLGKDEVFEAISKAIASKSLSLEVSSPSGKTVKLEAIELLSHYDPSVVNEYRETVITGELDCFSSDDVFVFVYY